MKYLQAISIIFLFFSCVKKDIPTPTVPSETMESANHLMRIEIGHENFKNLSIKLNSQEMDKREFLIDSGDVVEVVVENFCQSQVYYGLGDTIGHAYNDCNENEIKLFLDDEFIDGDHCPQASMPYNICPSDYQVNYTFK
ncbi:hypothetical protein DNU06_00985 [Putridiphycobacter roseus]|uniref:Uncharacterized protein n=1 Tax=Putridiphycobacter roseus TaxID=2219161 RepID=A0A2W1N4C1_9FLAO|nr:hypothetical protein [Putridiphycobacter roseus]PZE18440.1 hypothetical protein DNU06_00985 [Putridiphycobacter roseus]